MRATVVRIPTSGRSAACDWPRPQGGRRRTSASGGTSGGRAYEGRRATPGASPRRPPLAVARLRSRLANDARERLTPPRRSVPFLPFVATRSSTIRSGASDSEQRERRSAAPALTVARFSTRSLLSASRLHRSTRQRSRVSRVREELPEIARDHDRPGRSPACARARNRY